MLVRGGGVGMVEWVGGVLVRGGVGGGEDGWCGG